MNYKQLICDLNQDSLKTLIRTFQKLSKYKKSLMYLSFYVGSLFRINNEMLLWRSF